MDRWVGKTAVVTGASAGIGAAICVALANAGLRVVGLARRPELIDELQSEVHGQGSICSRKCDVTQSHEVAAAFNWVDETFGGTQVLVNNAGLLFQGQLTDVGDHCLSEENILATIDVNLKGPILCTRKAVESMKRQNFDGHIITINSVAGHYYPFTPTFNVYTSTKHAITALMASLNNEFAHFKNKIKTTSISPALVGTSMVKEMFDKPDLVYLRPSDVADTILYVLSTPPAVNITELTIMSVTETLI